MTTPCDRKPTSIGAIPQSQLAARARVRSSRPRTPAFAPDDLSPSEHAAVLLLASAIEHEHLAPAALWPHLRLGAARALRELAAQTRTDAGPLREDDGATLCAYADDLEQAAHAIEREAARNDWRRTKQLRRWDRVRPGSCMGPGYRAVVLGTMRDAWRLFVLGGL